MYKKISDNNILKNNKTVMKPSESKKYQNVGLKMNKIEYPTLKVDQLEQLEGFEKLDK